MNALNPEPESLSPYLETRHTVNSMERLLSLEESNLDTILASIPLGTRALVKRTWLDTRPSR